MLNKELLLMAGNQMKGMYKITVDRISTSQYINYGWNGLLHVGEMKPQDIGGFPITSMASSPYNVTTINFVKNSAIQFSSITVTRLDNESVFVLDVSNQGVTYFTTGMLFREEDVGKTIDLIIEAT